MLSNLYFIGSQNIWWLHRPLDTRPGSREEDCWKTLITIMSIAIHPISMDIKDPVDIKTPVGIYEPLGTLISQWTFLTKRPLSLFDNESIIIHRRPMVKMFTIQVSTVNPFSPNPPQSNDNPMVTMMITVHCLATWCLQGNVPSQFVELCQPGISES